MGRPPWATPEQTEYLESFLPNLDREKEGNGLTAHYDYISSEFLKKWPAEPTNEDRKDTSDLRKPQQLAEARRKKVSHCFNLREGIGADRSCQQIHQWYKTRRKQGPRASKSKTPLDLAGKSNRKRAPYQFHHAFSVRYFGGKDSPLRREVDDLWNRRGEKSVIDLLAPFMHTDDSSHPQSHNPDDSSRLQFHNAVMRWKCSLLTDEQRQEHHEWIEQTRAEKEDEARRPWKAVQDVGDDELLVENMYIQKYVRLFVASHNNAAN